VTETDTRVRDAILIGLTFAAGGVDAVSFLGLGQIFTANMTGNTVLLAVSAAQQNLFPAVRSLLALIAFSMGAFAAGRYLGREEHPKIWPPRHTPLLLIELVLLLGFAIGWLLTSGHPERAVLYPLIVTSAFAMGLQAALARSFALKGITTTVMTTALTGLMADLAALGTSGPAQRRWAAVIVALFAGAVSTGVVMIHAYDAAPLLPVTAVAAVSLLALVRFRHPVGRES
jgi:uncharacterized membrane protein YoaK (UPF0700 family)